MRTGGSAWKAVDRGLRSERDDVAGTYLQMQVDRYEKVLFEWWDRATTGHDVRAANVVLRTLERLDDLLRLTKGDHAPSQESVVIAADHDAYVKQLQQVVEQRARSAR